MSKAKLEAVLENIITLTNEKDSNALEFGLAQTLFALADIKNMQMYSAGNINRAKYALLKSETLPKDTQIQEGLIGPLSQCLSKAEITSIQHQDKKLMLFPLMCSKIQPLAIIVVEESHDTCNHDLIIQILRIYHNFISLMNENERDSLTGLLNRKTFDQKISSIIAELLSRKKEPNADANESAYLAIFDIDHFKRVNDAYGHLAGDEVLLLFSRLTHKNFRDDDLLFRFGGEEFIGIFKCANDETISVILNRFRQVIAHYDFPKTGKVTVSCGFTKIEALDIPSKTIDRADMALYHAKNNGRNQVSQHEQLIASGVLSE
ncbi:MAG: GGDEF domain-containing protein [Methylophilaceae bacterium]